MITSTQQLIARALKEDIGFGDITTQAIIDEGRVVKASITSKETLVVSGLDVAQQVFETLGDLESWKAKRINGDTCMPGTVLVDIDAPAGLLLSAERTALNFLQHLSGVATLTQQFVKAVDDTGIKIVDTRKTIPGLRKLEKKAVLHGGGFNHRMGLFDQYLIKDNHIDIAGGIAKAIKRAKEHRHSTMLIEVEVRNDKELDEALKEGVDVIMLDNWPIDKIDTAIKTVDGQCKIELSGGITLDNIKDYTRPGIDYISAGSLTHSAKAVDIGMTLQP